MSTNHLRDVPVGWFFRWAKPHANESGSVYRVAAGTEPGKDRVTAEAINTEMMIAPYSVYSGEEEVRAI